MTAASELLRSGNCILARRLLDYQSSRRFQLRREVDVVFRIPHIGGGLHMNKILFSAIKSYVRCGGICFAWDVGAHFGFYSLMMARQGGPHARVYALEPEPLSFARLQKHIYINNLESRVSLFQTGG